MKIKRLIVRDMRWFAAVTNTSGGILIHRKAA